MRALAGDLSGAFEPKVVIAIDEAQTFTTKQRWGLNEYRPIDNQCEIANEYSHSTQEVRAV